MNSSSQISVLTIRCHHNWRFTHSRLKCLTKWLEVMHAKGKKRPQWSSWTLVTYPSATPKQRESSSKKPCQSMKPSRQSYGTVPKDEEHVLLSHALQCLLFSLFAWPAKMAGVLTAIHWLPIISFPFLSVFAWISDIIGFLFDWWNPYFFTQHNTLRSKDQEFLCQLLQFKFIKLRKLMVSKKRISRTKEYIVLLYWCSETSGHFDIFISIATCHKIREWNATDITRQRWLHTHTTHWAYHHHRMSQDIMMFVTYDPSWGSLW